MKYFAIVLRIAIILSGIQMIMIGKVSINNPPFVSGIAIILIGLYFGLQAIIGPKAMLCPFTKKCREKMGCKSEK